MSLTRLIPMLLLVLSGVLAAAQEAVPAPSASPSAKPQLDEQTQQLLAKLKTNLQSAQTCQYNAQTTIKMEADGQKREDVAKYSVFAKRPNKFLIQCEGGRLDGLTLLSDGKYLYTYSATDKVFKKEDAPEQLTDLAAEGYLPPDPLFAFVSAFIEQDPLAPILEGVDSGTYGAKETLEGVDAERLHFSLSDMDWDLWMGAGDKPFPVRIKPDLTKSFAQQSPQMANVKVDMNVAYSNWSIGQDLPDDRFAFKPVEGANELKEPQHPLVGQPAPGFSVDLLDGAKLDLAQHKGKDVVILDFWATSCKPCQATMPILEKVAGEYKDKNVVLYAVNGGEESTLIKQFLNTLGLTVKVALDSDAAVSQLYRAESIPQVVIIGKDGIIKNVQVGAGPGMERRYRKMIEAALEPAPAS